MTLTEVMCFAIYNSAMTVGELNGELDDVLATGRDDAWGSEAMESLVSRAYEALADSVEDGEARLYGVCIDQTGGPQRPKTSAAAQLAEIPFPDCGELIHDLCGNVLLQRSAIDNPDIDDVRTWQDVAMLARDAQAVMRRFAATGEELGAAESQCQAWLEDQMRNSLHQRTKSRSELCAIAQKEFHVSGRRFGNVIWPNAIKKTGATAWSKAGAIPGSPRKKRRR